MREVVHRVSGGLAALSAATLAAFATDVAARPTSWAIPAAVAVLVTACNVWMLSRGGWSRESRQAAALRAADKATFEDLTALMTRDVMGVLKEQDFGDAWRDRLVVPLYEYKETRGAVEHQFHDRELEDRRQRLHTSVSEFTDRLGAYSHVTESGAGFFELGDKPWTRSHPPGDEHDRRFQAQRRELNELADRVVDAYDELVGEARSRVP